jgi:hypothetical protein
MNLHTQLCTELHLFADQAEAKACAIRASAAAGPLPYGTEEDHRVEMLGELLDAIDRVHPGLGTKLFLAMSPLSTAEDLL